MKIYGIYKWQHVTNLLLEVSKMYMTFILVLSKIFQLFLAPACWIAGLLIWRRFARSLVIRKRLAIAAIFLFLVFSNEFIFIKVVDAWQPREIEVKGRQFEEGILLGGFVSFDKNRHGYFNTACDRFLQACKLYKQGTIKKIIVSGGSLWGNSPAEAEFVKKELTAVGVKEEDIIAENRSRNTYQNALFSKKVADSMKLQGPALLITSALHIRRATLLFEKAGLSVTGYPCDYKVIDRTIQVDDYILPNIGVLNTWPVFIKEVAGILIYKIAGKA